MTVILGTLAHATAVTILAPSLAIPPASYSLPTMKPTAQTQEGWCRVLGGSVSAPPCGRTGLKLGKRCQQPRLTRYVLEKNQRNVPLAAQFDEMCPLK